MFNTMEDFETLILSCLNKHTSEFVTCESVPHECKFDGDSIYY